MILVLFQQKCTEEFCCRIANAVFISGVFAAVIAATVGKFVLHHL